jgi:hypothetical protein
MRPVVALAVLLVASPALGQTPEPQPDPMRLDYTSAPTCVNEATFRHMVGARLFGADPFTTDAPELLVLKLHRRGPAFFAADLAIYDAAGERTQHRVLSEPDCTALVEGAATIVGGWLRPLVLPPAKAKAPPAEVPPPAAPEPVVVAAPAPAPAAAEPPARAVEPRPAARPVQFRVGAVARAEFGTGLRPAFGVALDAGARMGWFSIAAEFHWVPSAGPTLADLAGVDTTLIVGALVVCGHVGQRLMFVGCLLGEAGQIQRAPGRYVALQLPTGAYRGGGARAGIEIPVVSPLHFQVVADLLGVVEPHFKVHRTTVVPLGAVGGLAGGLGAGLGAAF